jgi:hypothetical protein
VVVTSVGKRKFPHLSAAFFYPGEVFDARKYLNFVCYVLNFFILTVAVAGIKDEEKRRMGVKVGAPFSALFTLQVSAGKKYTCTKMHKGVIFNSVTVICIPIFSYI